QSGRRTGERWFSRASVRLEPKMPSLSSNGNPCLSRSGSGPLDSEKMEPPSIHVVAEERLAQELTSLLSRYRRAPQATGDQVELVIFFCRDGATRRPGASDLRGQVPVVFVK